ncbi:MAG TPA: PQQ-binding-like beta-propeller repeat protein [Candidatus Methylomirabilis sp.]|nr:PQQ-binding-like beta-propeller repeat protein [Candidatus Methylomirabilis sp.]
MQTNIIIKILVIFILVFSVNITSAGGLEPPLKVVWKSRLGIASTDIYPQSINLIVSDIAYVDYGGIKAIDINNGKLLWSKDWSAGLVYKDGILYAARDLSLSLYALNARTGEEIWKKEYPELKVNAVASDLTISNDTLYIMTKYSMGQNFWVIATDTDGNLKWQHKYHGQTLIDTHLLMSTNAIVIPYITSSPDFAGSENNLIGLNLTTGDIAWEIKNISFEGNPLSYPLSYKDILFIDRLRERDSLDYLFNWKEVPGKDNVKFKEFLKQEFGISWIENATIEKFDNGNEIRVTSENNFLSLGIYNENVHLQIDDGRNADFMAKNENDRLNIYSFEKSYILAVSDKTGETIWKEKVGNSYGNILAVKDEKLYVNSEKIKVLNPENGETIVEYSSKLDPSSFGSILGLPGLLGYNPAVISDDKLYIASTGPSPSIYSIDLNTGDLLWKGGKGGLSPYIYKDRLYLIVFGQLHAYEHGIEEKDQYANFNLFYQLGFPLLLLNLFIYFKKYNGKLYQSFQFSSILIIIAFFLITSSETLSNQYLNLMDERLLISTPPDWMLYQLFPAISVITGTFAGLKFRNNFIISAASGLAPFILAVAVSFLFLSINDKIIFLFSMVPLFISIPKIIIISLFYGVIGSIIGRRLKKIRGE